MTLTDHLLTSSGLMALVCCLAVAYGALHDMAVRTVPNTVSALVGSLGLLQAQISGTLALSSIIAAIVFLVGGRAWRASLLGAGDVKLIAASSLWVGPAHVPSLLTMIAIAGGLLACLYLVLQHVLPKPRNERPDTLIGRVRRVELRRIKRRGPLPYAVAIASATLFCIIQR